MIELKNFQTHINGIEPKEWNELFELLADKDNENINEGIFFSSEWKPSATVWNVLAIIEQLKLAPVFDWTSWTKGINILKETSSDYNQLDTVTLCMLLTVISRADRFNEGFAKQCFENGKIAGIIKSIKRNQGL